MYCRGLIVQERTLRNKKCLYILRSIGPEEWKEAATCDGTAEHGSFAVKLYIAIHEWLTYAEPRYGVRTGLSVGSDPIRSRGQELGRD